ncbi:hypothetical protein ACO3TA_01770 [Methanocaldococcus sp. 28A]
MIKKNIFFLNVIKEILKLQSFLVMECNKNNQNYY